MGEVAIIGDGKRPETQTEDNTIRPGLIRFLALGGDGNAPIHEQGVQVEGAWIDGDLDLGACICATPLGLNKSKLNGDVLIRDARLTTLSLQGSQVGRLNASSLHTTGSLFLNAGFKATSEVHLAGAQIGGSLECSKGAFEPEDGVALSFDGALIKGSVVLCDGFKATGTVRFLGTQIGGALQCDNGAFEPEGGYALACDRAMIKGSVFLRDGFKATGTVRLLGVQIGGNLDCNNGVFEPKDGDALACDRAVIKRNVFLRDGFKATGAVSLIGAQIGGDLICINGSFESKKYDALALDNASIAGSLMLRNVAAISGGLNLTGCHVRHMVDDARSWSLAPSVILDGFHYDRIIAGPTDAGSRVTWLRHAKPKKFQSEFWPQPWEQLIKVLREMGHDHEARDVAIAKQEAMREAGKFRDAAWLLHWLYGALAGYGYRPLRSVLAMLVACFICGVIYQGAGDFGLMAPTSPIIHADPKLQGICGMESLTRETQWTICKAMPQEYTTFSPYLYSLDVILPFVDLQQEKDWAPVVTRDDGSWIKYSGSDWIWPGAFVRFVMWFEILFGWAMSLLLVAVLGNLVKKD